MTEFTKGAAYVDQKLVPITEAKISLLDWGFLHSDATYDVVHVWNGKFFRLDDHLERFYSGMKKLHMEIPYHPGDLVSILQNCVKATGLQNAYVEMIATRGLPEPGSRDPRSCTNRFFAFAIPFVWISKPGEGLNLIVSQRQRIPSGSVDPSIKNYHWLDLVMGQYEAYDRGAETAVLTDADGYIKEGPGFNIFSVKDSILTTPATGILEGITRKTIIELASIGGYKVVKGNLSEANVLAADEVFATSTAGGVMPITQINSKKVGLGSIGAITEELQRQYWLLHEDARYGYPVDKPWAAI